MTQTPEVSKGTGLRRLAVLIAALGLMLGLHLLRLDEWGGAGDPLTLAAIGFVILASFTIGEAAAALGVPKVTGYIVAGMALGPSISGLLSDQVVSDMSTFNTLALGLIALSAGLELHIPAIVRVGRTLASIVALKLPLLLVLVGGAVVGMQTFWPTVDVPAGAPLWGFAAILAVLGVGTSPAIALAVVNDARAKGRLTDLVLGIAVVKDLVVVVCLAVVLAVTRSALEGSGGGGDIVGTIAIELLGSVALGAALGGLLILYVRLVKAEMLAFAVGIVLVTAEVTALLHLELLLVFIAAGFVVRNFSTHEHDLLHPIERVSLPVFVVFFTTAGAALNLKGALGVLPLAMVIALARVVAYWLASRGGTQLGNESPPIRQNAWLAFLPQAGVTLGLVLLAAQAVPTLAEPIRSVGMALVAINLLVGPITLGMALKRAGETPSSAAPEPAEPGPAVTAAPHAKAPVLLHPSTLRPEPIAPETPARALEEELALPLITLEAQLDQELAISAGRLARDAADTLHRLVDDVLVDLEAGRPEAMARHLMPDEVILGDAEIDRALLSLTGAASRLVRAVPRRLVLPMASDLLEQRSNDGVVRRWQRFQARAAYRLTRRGREREVLLRVLVRVELDRRVAEALREAVAGHFRVAATISHLLGDAAVGERSAEDARQRAHRAADDWAEAVETDIRAATRRALAAARGAAAIAGGPDLPVSESRYSRVEADVQEAVAGGQNDLEGWQGGRRALVGSLLARVQVYRCRAELDALVSDRLLGPLEDVTHRLTDGIAVVLERLTRLKDEFAADASAVQARGAALVAWAEAAWPKDERRSLRRTRVQLRRSARPDRLASTLDATLWRTSGQLEVLDADLEPEQIRRPSDLRTRSLKLDQRLEADMAERLIPALVGALEASTAVAGSVPARVGKAVEIARYGLELATTGDFDDPKVRLEVSVSSIVRAIDVLDELMDELITASEQAKEQLHEIRQAAASRWSALLDWDSDAGTHRVASAYYRLLRSAAAAITDYEQRGRQAFRTLRERLEAIGARRDVRDRRLRSGHERLDPAGMADYVSDWIRAPETLGLPAVYTRLFALEPVADPRFFVAHRELRRVAVQELAEAGWSDARSVLVVGDPGSGRTSLINNVLPALRGQRVFRVDPAMAEDRSIVSGVAAELGCAAQPDAVAAALTRTPTWIILDDLEQWLDPTPSGLADLQRFTALVLATAPRVRWLVSITTPTEALLASLVCLREVFTRRVVLPSLSWKELRTVVEMRQALGGFTVQYSVRGRWAGRVPVLRDREAETYFRALGRTSHGNLRAAIIAHLLSVAPGTGALLQAGPPPDLAIPFLGWLPNPALAALSLVVRFGPATVRDLAVALQLDEQATLAHIRVLQRAGLLIPQHHRRDFMEAPRHVAPSLHQSLVATGVLPEGSP